MPDQVADNDSTTTTAASSSSSSSGSHLVLLLELLLFLIGLGGVLVMQVDRQQPEPYMDEVFHVPMAQRYCRGDYASWDPKITTPPGLYAFAAWLLRASALVFGPGVGGEFNDEVWCSTFNLRLTNLLPLTVCLLAQYGIVSSIASPGGLSPRVQVLKAFSISLLPVSLFFSSLFYTDQLSIACVLIMYFLHLNQHTVLAAVFGTVSLACRQTNIIWTCLCLGELVEAKWLQRAIELAKKTDEPVQFDPSSIASSLWHILQQPIAFARTVLAALATGWPHLLTMATFVTFLIMNNGSVALGDKEAHRMQLHLAHPLYYLAFVASMQPYAFLHPRIVRLCLKQLTTIRGVAMAIALCTICCCLVAMGTVEHPYLLADNRHFTFYLWRWLVKRHWLMPYALVPVYVYCLFAYCQLAKHTTSLFPILHLVCTACILIPAGLIEPRYYLLSFIIWRLHSATLDNRLLLAMEIAYYALINAGVYRLFLKHSFQWPDASLQRFMW